MGNVDPVLDSSLSQIGSGQNVFRAWFFQKLATSNGARDWTAFDHTLAVAAARGQKVIVTLADQWGACEEVPTPVYKDETWYASGYKTIVRSGIVPYREWVSEIVRRYANEPVILAWQLMNEAEDAPARNTACTTTAASTLKSWAADVAAIVKSLDRNHLLSIGTSGGGQCGAVYTQYKDLYSLQDVDLCEYHDYGPPSAAMPGDRWNGLLFRIQQCRELNKPIFVGEVGISGADVTSLSARAEDFAAKFDAQFAAGVAGILLWGWRDSAHGGSSLTDYDIGPNDPVLGVLARY
jgi:mannan endo-1,4-beta-mannosidase